MSGEFELAYSRTATVDTFWEAIHSLVSQICTRFSLGVSDDCSTDDTALVVHDFAKKDGRMLCHRNSYRMGIAQNYRTVF